MAGQYNLNTNQLKHFAPHSPILAFRPESSGSPQEDWCKHLQEYPHFRRELEEFAVLGDVVVRIADGIEPAPIEHVKILSLEYAVKTLHDETDAKEFVRIVKAIASPDADQWELEQIAAFYYKEIRRRGVSEVLKEMGLLGVQMETVTATVQNREIDIFETEIEEQKLTVAEQRKVSAMQKNLPPLPTPTPIFDDELAAVKRRIGNSKITRMKHDDFADYYLNDEGKSCEELDADFMSFERLEQYDENGIVGFSMSGGQHSVVVYDFKTEVDGSYLPGDIQSLAREMNLIFVGFNIGGLAAQKARQFVFEQRVLQNEVQAAKKGFPSFATPIPPIESFSNLPFSEANFSEWLVAKLEFLYPHRTLRNVRRVTTNKAGISYEYPVVLEVNPDFEEMQYVAAVCQTLWMNLKADFHLRSLRKEAYQNLHLAIRKTEDTAEVARLKKRAYDEFKEQKKLTLKEFTALNTAAKSQEARLKHRTSQLSRKTLADIESSSLNRLRYFKYFLYNDEQIQALTRQEKQRLWDAVRTRETILLSEVNTSGKQTTKTVQQTRFRQPTAQKQVVRVTPRSA